jgi:hypothetical protein
MIEPVQASPAREPRQAGSPAASSAGNFAAVLSDASDATADRFERLRRELRVPKGERWEAVPGHSDYADIVSGPRNGSYVNLADGPRRGDVFQRILKDGREYHVYGEGHRREVVEVERRGVEPRRRDPERVRPAEGETFEAVTGHRDYQRIEGGARDDHFINLSGNERTGRAFNIVERDGHRYHVYGEGDDKVEIMVGLRRRPAAGGDPPAAGGDPPATGGDPET